MPTDKLTIKQWFVQAKHARGLSLDITNSNDETSVGKFVPEGVKCSASVLSSVVTGHSKSIGCSGSYVYVQSDQQTLADYGVGAEASSPLYRYVYASYIDDPAGKHAFFSCLSKNNCDPWIVVCNEIKHPHPGKR